MCYRESLVVLVSLFGGIANPSATFGTEGARSSADESAGNVRDVPYLPEEQILLPEERVTVTVTIRLECALSKHSAVKETHQLHDEATRIK